MTSQITPNMRLQHLQNYNKNLMRGQKNHVTRRMCQDSNWPVTGDLTPQEIACMRDTYCGKRRAPSYVQPRYVYDCVHHPTLGWNQWATRDVRENAKGSQYSAKDEDFRRAVVVEANNTYGHYVSNFFDFTVGDHPHNRICEHQFYRGNCITNLPPIRNV